MQKMSKNNEDKIISDCNLLFWVTKIEYWVKTVKVKIEKEVKTLGDLFYLLSPEDVRRILKQMGAKFETIPDVELGNLRIDSIHGDYYISAFRFHRKTDGGYIGVLIGNFDPEWEIDEHLVVDWLTPEESLKCYAKMIMEEYKDMSDKQLAQYRCLGRKRFDRARDEMLRRKIIEKAGDISRYEEEE